MQARTQTVSHGRSHPVVGFFARILLRGCSYFPLWSLQAVGGAAGWVLACLPSQARSRSLINLRLCLPELSERERKRIARRALAAMGGMALETGLLWRLSRERMLGLARKVHGQEHMDAALAANKGVILATAHLGSWEFLCFYISAQFTETPMTAMFRPSRVREMDTLFLEGRGHLGALHVPAGVFAVRSLRRALSRGEFVIVLPDTDPKVGQSVFAPLFGVPANTSTLIPRLAHDSGATVLCCYAERLPRGAGYDIHFAPASEAVAGDDVPKAVAALNKDVEALIRTKPEQYLWRYRRFKRRPEGEPPLYK